MISLPGLKVRSQEFTAGGTWSNPGVEWVYALLVAGGGGGAGGAATTSGGIGGSGGEVVFRMLRVTGDITVTIGAGGAGGAIATDGSNGSNSTMTHAGSTVLIAHAGKAGSNALGGGRPNTGVEGCGSFSSSFGGTGGQGGQYDEPSNVLAAQPCVGFGEGGSSGGVVSSGAGGGGSFLNGADGDAGAGDDAPANGGGGGAGGGVNMVGGDGADGYAIIYWVEQ